MKIPFLFLFLLVLGTNLYAQNNTSALDFDGIDDLDSVPNTEALLEGATAMSLSLWVKPRNAAPSYPNFDAFAGYKNESQSDFYLIQIGTTQVEARFRNSDGTAFDILYNGLVLNDWNHFVFTYDGSKTTLYRNGVQVGTRTANGTMGNPGINFLIGAVVYVNLTAFKLDGQIDEVGLWNISLTPQQIADLMLCHPHGTEPGLVGYWALNEGDGNETQDLSSGNHPGILLNGPTWMNNGMPTYNCPAVAVGPVTKASPVAIFPNPFHTSTTISLGKLSGPVSFSLHDARGLDLTPNHLKNPVLGPDNSLKIDKDNLPNGLYFIRIGTTNETITRKLAIE